MSAATTGCIGQSLSSASICSSSRAMRSPAPPMVASASSRTTRCAGWGRTEEAEGNREDGGWASKLAQVTPVRLGPRAFARVTVAVAQEEGFELRPAAPLILHRVGAGAAEVAHGFIAGVGHMHRRQLAGPVQPRQLQRVAPVGLDPVPAPARDQRRGHDGAVDLQLREPPCDDETRRPRVDGSRRCRPSG